MIEEWIMGFWFPLIGVPIENVEMIVLASSVIAFALLERPQKLFTATLYAWGTALIITHALPNVSSNGYFNFREFTELLMLSTLGTMLFRFIIIFIVLYLARRLVKEFSPRKLFSKK